MRRPFISTRVELAPRPRSEMPDAPAAKPLTKLIGTEPWLSTPSVCRYSATVALPDFSISSRLITVTGDAVSVATRGIFDPVTSTRSTAWPKPLADTEINEAAANAWPTTNAMRFFLIIMTCSPPAVWRGACRDRRPGRT